MRILAAVAAAAALGAAGHQAAAPPGDPAPEAPPQAAFAPHGPAPVARAKAGAISWWGGRLRAATGEEVTVLISDAYPRDEAVAQRWADWFASLVHGDELTSVTVNIAAPAEVEQLCAAGSLGCYGGDRLVTVGEEVDGVAATEVAAHEYGHHVAAHRANPPWNALTWGPKRWATAMSVCRRAAAGELHPGDQGRHYRLNPGEGFAEAYRLLHERRADPLASSWPILSSQLFPSVAALAAAEADVVQPWAQKPPAVVRARFVARRPSVWSVRVATPLDGQARVTLDLPPATPYRLVLALPEGRVLARGAWESGTRQSATATVCGTRALAVRVERQGPPARFVVRMSVP